MSRVLKLPLALLSACALLATSPASRATDSSCTPHRGAWQTSFNFLRNDAAKVVEHLPSIPKENSPEEQAELEQILDAQNTRTDADCKRALSELDPYNLAAFFPPPLLSPQEREVVAPLLKAAAADVDLASWPLKDARDARAVLRQRPHIRYPNQVHPCAGLAQEHDPVTCKLYDPVTTYNPGNSYPSGHAAISRIQALVLGEIFPDRRARFLERADQIAQDRVTLGVHYPSDIEAGKKIADKTFAILQKSSVFQAALLIPACQFPNSCAAESGACPQLRQYDQVLKVLGF